jgi:putative FmdB family regulatory protein
MPFYDFHCDKCELTFEVLHGLAEPGPKKCPRCNSKKVQRAFTSPPAYHNHYSPMHPRATRGRGH